MLPDFLINDVSFFYVMELFNNRGANSKTILIAAAY
jgi:hypothetical protein